MIPELGDELSDEDEMGAECVQSGVGEVPV